MVNFARIYIRIGGERAWWEVCDYFYNIYFRDVPDIRKLSGPIQLVFSWISAHIARNIAETCQKYFQSFIAMEILPQHFC